MRKLKVGRVLADSTVDGPGIRTVLFLAGCSHTPKCEGCHNQWLWSPSSGYTISTDDLIDELIGYGLQFTDLTITGGEPLDQYEGLVELLEKLKQRDLGGDIWLYTGYTFEEVKVKFPLILDYIVAIVDGKYDKTKPEFNPNRFRGSWNQKIWINDGEWRILF